MAIYTTFSNSKEIGFGSATASPQLDIVDMGFGAPMFIEYTLDGDTFQFRNQNETSHGDPFEEVEIIVIEREDQDRLSDHGGEVIKLFGRFDILYEALSVVRPQELQPIGPFFFKFKGLDSHNSALEYVCYSGMPGYGSKCYTNDSQRSISFCTLPMLKGNYELIISYGAVDYTFPTSFRVIHRLRNDKTVAIRENIPRWMDRGDTIDDIVPSIQYRKGLESNIAILTDAMGQSLNNIYDNNYTVITQDYKHGDTVLHVETTLEFPSSGTVRVGGLYDMTYVGKDDTRFIGVSFDTNEDIIRINNRVYRTHKNFGDIQNFYKIKNTGFFKPSERIREETYLDAFNIIEYGERTTEQVIFAYLYEMFKHLNVVKSVNITDRTVSAPNDGTTWNCSHVGRLCKINDTFYYVIGEDLDGAGTLLLDDIGCSYWNGTHIQGENGFTANEYTIEIIPWMIDRDFNGLFDITFEKSVFASKDGFIDKDYIDFNLYIDGGEESSYENNNGNMNIELLKAAGIIDSIRVVRRCDSLFGTFISQEAAPDGLFIEPQRRFAQD